MNSAESSQKQLPFWAQAVIAATFFISELAVMVGSLVLAAKAGETWWATVGLMSMVMIPAAAWLFVLKKAAEHLGDKHESHES